MKINNPLQRIIHLSRFDSSTPSIYCCIVPTLALLSHNSIERHIDSSICTGVKRKKIWIIYIFRSTICKVKFFFFKSCILQSILYLQFCPNIDVILLTYFLNFFDSLFYVIIFGNHIIDTAIIDVQF